MGGQHVRTLELLATTHYVYSELRKNRVEPDPQAVAQSVVALKPHLSADESVQALATLKQEGLC